MTASNIRKVTTTEIRIIQKFQVNNSYDVSSVTDFMIVVPENVIYNSPQLSKNSIHFEITQMPVVL